MLSRLWFLELVFPPVNPVYILLGSPAYHDWDETMSYVLEQLGSQRGLLGCLRIFVNDFPDDYPDDSLTIEERSHVDHCCCIWYMSGLCRRCRSSRETGYLIDAFVFGAGPFSWPDPERIEQRLGRRSWDATVGMIVCSWGKRSNERVNASNTMLTLKIDSWNLELGRSYI